MIPLLIPLSLRGVRYRPIGASALLRRNLWIYGLGGIIAPFIGIKLIDLIVHNLLGALSARPCVSPGRAARGPGSRQSARHEPIVPSAPGVASKRRYRLIVTAIARNRYAVQKGAPSISAPAMTRLIAVVMSKS